MINLELAAQHQASATGDRREAHEQAKKAFAVTRLLYALVRPGLSQAGSESWVIRVCPRFSWVR